jgi:hypothetical protein
MLAGGESGVKTFTENDVENSNNQAPSSRKTPNANSTYRLGFPFAP